MVNHWKKWGAIKGESEKQMEAKCKDRKERRWVLADGAQRCSVLKVSSLTEVLSSLG